MNERGLWKKRLLVSVLSFSLAAGWNTALAAAAGSSPDLEWDRTFDQLPGEAQQTKDGGFIIIGEPHYSQPNSFVKTDGQGKVVWSKPIMGETVQQTKDGGYIIAAGGGSKVDPVFNLRKTDASGETLWTSSMKGSVVKGIKQIRETNDGGYIFIGYESIVKVDSNGKAMWRKDSPDSYSLTSVQQTADGGYLIGGGSYSALRLLKLDASGNASWTKTYSNSGKMDYATGYAVQTPDGGYAIAGHSDGQFILFKTDAAGNEQWSKTYGGQNKSLTSLRVAGDGGYLLGGYERTRELKYSELHNNVVLKTNASGEVQWAKTIGSSETENVDYMLKQVLPTQDGGAVTFGWKVKISSDGVFQGGFTQLAKLSAKQTVPDSGLWLDSEDYSLSVGQTIDTVLKAVYAGKKVTVTKDAAYTIADPAVASVDAAGNITGLKNGQTVLTAAYKGMSVKANVYVYGTAEQPEPGSRLDSEDYSVSVGQSLDTVLTAVYGGKEVVVNKSATFKIADPSIASVDAAGNITGLKYGQTVLTATYNSMETTARMYVY